MADLEKAYKDLLKNGLAEKASGEVIFFTGAADPKKLAEMQRSYAKSFYERWQERIAKERKAEEDLHDFVITY